MASIAIKITPSTATGWGTDINFYDYEVLNRFDLKYQKTNTVQDNLRTLPIVYDPTVDYVSANVDYRQVITGAFYLKKYDTLTKYRELFDVKRKMRVYYKYISDTSTYVVCVLDPNRTEYYVLGEYQGSISVPVNFIRIE